MVALLRVAGDQGRCPGVGLTHASQVLRPFVTQGKKSRIQLQHGPIEQEICQIEPKCVRRFCTLSNLHLDTLSLEVLNFEPRHSEPKTCSALTLRHRSPTLTPIQQRQQLTQLQWYAGTYIIPEKRRSQRSTDSQATGPWEPKTARK